MGVMDKERSAYTNPAGGELARMGRILMDKSVTVKDDALSNVLGRLGDELTRYGEPGGASSIDELSKKVRLSKEQILKMMKWAQQQKDTSLQKVKDPDPKPDEDEKEESVATENTPIGHTDDERNMIRKELYQMAKYAKEMFEMLEDLPADSDFPHWWQAKVVKSLQMISKAKHYLENELNVPDVGGDRTEEGILDTMWDASKQAIRDPDVDWDKTKRESDMVYDLQDAGYSDKEIKMAYGILNDPRYKGGNLTGAMIAIEKLAPGMSDEPALQKVVKATQESICAECGKARFTALPEEMQKQYESVNEEKQKGVDGKVCWKGYKRMGTKKKGGKTVDNCVKM